ncbi:MAG: hypothetical protein KGL95_02830, partial [Patescibacteria group bacterium]|nr:hypothetical protein [Patescibacteria group bacterium]
MHRNIAFFSFVGVILLIGAIIFSHLYSSNTPSVNAVPGTCKILEEKFCKTVKFVTLTSNHLVFAAYTIPTGTTLFSPEAYEYLQTFSNVVFFGDTKKLTVTTSLGHVQSDQNITANELNITFYTHNSLSNIQKDSSGSIQQTGIKNDKIGQLASS